jgi:hypothetical protein
MPLGSARPLFPPLSAVSTLIDSDRLEARIGREIGNTLKAHRALADRRFPSGVDAVHRGLVPMPLADLAPGDLVLQFESHP